MRFRSKVTTVVLLLAALSACAAPEAAPDQESSAKPREDEPSAPGASDEEAVPERDTPPSTVDDPTPDPAPASSTAPPGSHAAGTRLLTLTKLNLRSEASDTASILTTIPVAVRVEVVSASGADGWANVTYGGKVGFASMSFLRLAKYSASRGKKMADRARSLWEGKSAGGYCLAGVRETAVTSGAIPSPPGWTPVQPSAVAWQTYANANPFELLKRGYVREALDATQAPAGSILGWAPGQCGFDARYGHIEVVADEGTRACSDYCGALKKCSTPPFVYVPIEL